ncbi:MAG: cytochrome c oxidase subunit II [Gemmatimonadales bacterium]
MPPIIRRHLGRLAIVCGLGAVACGGPFPQSTFAAHSDFADALAGLYTHIFWLAVAVFVVVEGLLLFIIIRYRQREGAAPPPQHHGHTGLELAWTLAPALILMFIAVPTVRTIFATSGAPEGALRVEVIGHQWWWEYRYPDLGVVTANELHLPVGRPVAIDLTSADVIHSWWTPALGGKRDAIPSRRTGIAFRPDAIGTYPGQCAEFCGTSHANMGLLTVVEPDAVFQAWVATQRRAGVTPARGSVEERGQQAFQRYGCIGCHTVTGLSSATIGPTLTHVGSRATLAGATMMNTEEHLRRWIADPPGMKPGALMPSMRVSADDLPALVAYLMSLQ